MCEVKVEVRLRLKAACRRRKNPDIIEIAFAGRNKTASGIRCQSLE